MAKVILQQLERTGNLAKKDIIKLIEVADKNIDIRQRLFEVADQARRTYYQNKVFARGLIEFSNFCRNDCVYCGIRRSNSLVERYRLDEENILATCDFGYRLGYRTFVLQGGEDAYYSQTSVCKIVSTIKQRFPLCAVTLSIGERSRAEYEAFWQAGVDRYLLRHETASQSLYKSLHPDMHWHNRIRCLHDLQDIGYQVGAGFMVGLPGQTITDLAADVLFLADLKPQMVGIGPFIPHQQTPLAAANGGTLQLSLIMIAIVRLFLPKALLPATTAMGTIDANGREQAILAGANVVMPNLTPIEHKSKYLLYDGKICLGDSADECRGCIERRINSIGFVLDMGRGDHVEWQNN